MMFGKKKEPESDTHERWMYVGFMSIGLTIVLIILTAMIHNLLTHVT